MQLQARRIQGDAPGPHLLLTGGVHGDEFEPMVAIRKIIKLIQPSSLRGQLTFVPVVNEAAFLRGHRTAEDNLDLARVCPGSPTGSITEQTAHALSSLIRQADFYIDLHTGGTEFSVLPLSGYSLHPDEWVLKQQRRMAHAFNLPIVWGTCADKEGRSLSIARDANVPAIYTEYRGSATCDPKGVEAYVEGCLNVMSELRMLDRPRPDSRIEHFVEDNRPDAGHMQVQNSSPLTGCFEPAVQLGDTLHVGDPIGIVSNILGNQTETVYSKQNGIVLVLRTFNRVHKGESLGVILETNLNKS